MDSRLGPQLPATTSTPGLAPTTTPTGAPAKTAPQTTDEKTTSVVRQMITPDAYDVKEDLDNSVTYISPKVQKEFEKDSTTEKVDKHSPHTKRAKNEKEVNRIFERATKGMVIEHNTLYMLDQWGERYSLRMSPEGLKEVIRHALDTKHVADRTFKLIEKERITKTNEETGEEEVTYKIVQHDIKMTKEGRIEIAEFITKGGCGEILKKFDLDMKELMIQKTAEGKNEMKNLLNEQKMIKIANPNGHATGIQRLAHHVIDLSGQAEGKKVTTLNPYYNQGSLEKALENKPLTPEQTISGAYQILTGGATLEKHKLLHQDIKMQNIFVNQERNGSVTMHVADFDGVAVLDKKLMEDPVWLRDLGQVSVTPGLSMTTNEINWISDTVLDLRKNLKELKDTQNPPTPERKKELEKENDRLWNNYQGMVKDAQTWSVANVVYQVIAGKAIEAETKNKLGVVDVDKLRQEVLKNPAISDDDKKNLCKVLDIIKPALTPTEDREKYPNVYDPGKPKSPTGYTYVQTRPSVEELRDKMEKAGLGD